VFVVSFPNTLEGEPLAKPAQHREKQRFLTGEFDESVERIPEFSTRLGAKPTNISQAANR
jgi:hypothetical protein